MFAEYIEMLKEDKPMKTKVHELLGVEPGERFTYKGYLQAFVMLADEEALRDDDGNELGSSILVELLLHKDGIILLHRLTDEQRKVLEALLVLGFKWVAVDEDKKACAYVCEPAIIESEWACVNESETQYGAAITARLDCLRPLIPDWTVPLDIDKTLGEAAREN